MLQYIKHNMSAAMNRWVYSLWPNDDNRYYELQRVISFAQLLMAAQNNNKY